MPSLGVSTFPTLYLYKKGSNKAPLEYHGEPNLGEMKRFITEIIAEEKLGGGEQGDL